MTALAPLLQSYFTTRLPQRGASPNTISVYRDTWRLPLTYLQTRGTAPATAQLDDVDAALIGQFLDHLTTVRGNSTATRNLRLTGIHGLFDYASLRCPEHADTIAAVLAIPTRRHPAPTVTYLTRPEADALLAAPDPTTALGRRDQVLLTVAIQTGLRVSELTGLNRADITLGVGAHISCTGKGRKHRTTPLTRPVARLLTDWLAHQPGQRDDPVFPARHGGRLSADAVSDLLARHTATAARTCPTLTGKHVTPHTLRHTAAMDLLHAGVDTSVIALWLGHASNRTTSVYLHADLSLKEQALARTAPRPKARHRYQPSDALLTFLENL